MAPPKWKQEAIPLDEAPAPAPSWRSQAIPLDEPPATDAPASPDLLPGQRPLPEGWKLVKQLPGEGRLVQAPDGQQVLIAPGFTADGKRLQRYLKPLEQAEKNRTEAARLRKNALETKQLSSAVRGAPTREPVLFDEAAAAALEKKANQQEAIFAAMMRRDIEQTMGAELAMDKPLVAGALQFLSGLPAAGGWIDEMLGKATQTQAQKEAGISQSDVVRGAMEATRQEAPLVSLGQQTLGGVTGAIAMPGFLRALTPRGATPGAQLASGTVRGSLIGGTEGAISGAGLAEEDDRATGAVIGGAVGAGLGGAFGALPPGAEDIMANARNYIARVDDNRLAQELGISREAATVLRSHLQADDFVAAAQALQRAGSSSMLVDASPALRDLLDAAMQAGGPGAKREARNEIEARAIAATARFRSFMDRILGIPRGREDQARGIRLASAPERERVYNEAYAVPIDYSSAAGRRLEAMLPRIPAAAINKANQLMQVEGHQSRQILADVADDGTVTFTQMPDVRQLDYIRRALGDIVEGSDGRGAMGGVTSYGRSVGELSRDIRDTLAVVVPEYRIALDTAADTISELNAARIGYRAFGGAMTREEVRDALGEMTDPERIAAQVGFRNAIDDKLARVGQIASDPNRDAREMQEITRNMTSPDFREKLETIVGPAQAANFMRQLDEEITAVQLRAAVNPNSATVRRSEVLRAVREQTRPNILQTLMRDGPVRAVKNLTQALSGTTDDAFRLRDQGVLDEISRVLTQTRGRDAQQALALIERSIAGQELNENQARFVARVLMRPSALGAASATAQYLRYNPETGEVE